MLAGAFAAFVLIGASLAVVASLVGDDQPGAGTTEGSAEIVASSAETSTPTTVPVVMPLSWVSTVVDDAGEPGSLAVGEAAYVLGSSICETVDGRVCEVQNPAVWVSGDAETWEQADDVVLSEADGGVAAVLAGDDRFVAIGTVFNPAGFTEGAVWVSPDGIRWEQASGDGGKLVGEGFTVVEAAAIGGPGYVAVGWVNPEGSHTDAAVWISSDGIAWDRVDDLDLLGDLNSGVPENIVGVVPGGPGFVAYGTSVWVSEDGTDWAKIETATTFDAIASDPTTGTLYGFADNQVWISADATAWTNIALLDETSDPAIRFAAIDGETIVAAGGDRTASVWESHDAGRSWIESIEAAQPEVEAHIVLIGSVSATDEGIVIAGAECDVTAAGCQPRTWTARLDSGS
jgi:hypothetical protein